MRCAYIFWSNLKGSNHGEYLHFSNPFEENSGTLVRQLTSRSVKTRSSGELNKRWRLLMAWNSVQAELCFLCRLFPKLAPYEMHWRWIRRYWKSMGGQTPALLSCRLCSDASFFFALKHRRLRSRQGNIPPPASSVMVIEHETLSGSQCASRTSPMPARSKGSASLGDPCDVNELHFRRMCQAALRRPLVSKGKCDVWRNNCPHQAHGGVSDGKKSLVCEANS